jgi:hypothetical protein
MSTTSDPQNSNKATGVGIAILIGQLVVNFPVLIIIIGISTIGILFTAFINVVISTLPSWFFTVGAGVSIIDFIRNSENGIMISGC